MSRFTLSDKITDEYYTYYSIEFEKQNTTASFSTWIIFKNRQDLNDFFDFIANEDLIEEKHKCDIILMLIESIDEVLAGYTVFFCGKYSLWNDRKRRYINYELE